MVATKEEWSCHMVTPQSISMSKNLCILRSCLARLPPTLSVIWPLYDLSQIFAIFLLSRSHFRLSFIGLSLHYHVLAIFSPLPLLCYPTYSCHYHAPSLLFCLPHFTTIITIQFHSLGIRGMVLVFCCHHLKVLQYFSLSVTLSAKLSEMFGTFSMVKLVTEDSH